MKHGSNIDPPNRFERIHFEFEPDQLEWEADYLTALQNRRIEYLVDQSESIVSENHSPDIPFRYSVNPYRGCAHACPYCYARNTHEYLGLNAGLDFETKIFVKRDAPELLRAFLSRKSWRPESITFCGATDCYQPAERQFRLTRGCLEVANEFNQPISLITKNALILRDLDLLGDLARCRLVTVSLSIATLDRQLASSMEPRASVPAARLRAVSAVAAAGVPVRVMVAPIIPGLTDSQAPAIMTAARQAGAGDARYVMLRLPLTVEPVFLEWLRRELPLQAGKIENRIRAARGGQLNQSEFGRRMTGSGEFADQFRHLFHLLYDKLGFADLPATDSSQFRVPHRVDPQRTFDWI